MREHGIQGRHQRRDQVTTDSKHALPVAANVLNRAFNPSAPNQVWSADITALWTDEELALSGSLWLRAGSVQS